MANPLSEAIRVQDMTFERKKLQIKLQDLRKKLYNITLEREKIIENMKLR